MTCSYKMGVRSPIYAFQCQLKTELLATIASFKILVISNLFKKLLDKVNFWQMIVNKKLDWNSSIIDIII